MKPGRGCLVPHRSRGLEAAASGLRAPGRAQESSSPLISSASTRSWEMSPPITVAINCGAGRHKAQRGAPGSRANALGAVTAPLPDPVRAKRS